VRIGDALIGTGFPFRQFAHVDAYLAILREVMQKAPGVRRAGAAALDLAYVAAGRLDAFWEFGLSPWDMAAGALLIVEAGGLVGDLEGNEGYLENGNVVGGNPKIFAQLVALIGTHLPQELRSQAGTALRPRQAKA
jgi:myo-inositol-1(or 4)-monophosphatase